MCDGTGAPLREGALAVKDGRIARIGLVADLVLFDPDTVASKTPRFAQDLPGGGRRLVADAAGVSATFVAGRAVCERGETTGERPGRVPRCGRD